jgi:hypothetical protein
MPCQHATGSWWHVAHAIPLIVALAHAMALADVIIITDDITVTVSDVHSDNVWVR